VIAVMYYPTSITVPIASASIVLYSLVLDLVHNVNGKVTVIVVSNIVTILVAKRDNKEFMLDVCIFFYYYCFVPT